MAGSPRAVISARVVAPLREMSRSAAQESGHLLQVGVELNLPGKGVQFFPYLLIVYLSRDIDQPDPGRQPARFNKTDQDLIQLGRSPAAAVSDNQLGIRLQLQPAAGLAPVHSGYLAGPGVPGNHRPGPAGKIGPGGFKGEAHPGRKGRQVAVDGSGNGVLLVENHGYPAPYGSQEHRGGCVAPGTQDRLRPEIPDDGLHPGQAGGKFLDYRPQLREAPRVAPGRYGHKRYARLRHNLALQPGGGAHVEKLRPFFPLQNMPGQGQGGIDMTACPSAA